MNEYENIVEFFKNVLIKKDLEKEFLACNGIQEMYDFTLNHCKNKFSKEYFEKFIKVIESESKKLNTSELNKVSGGWEVPLVGSVKDFFTIKKNEIPGHPELSRALQKQEPTHRSVAKITSSGLTALNLNIKLMSSLRDMYEKYQEQNTPQDRVIQELKEKIEDLKYELEQS